MSQLRITVDKVLDEFSVIRAALVLTLQATQYERINHKPLLASLVVFDALEQLVLIDNPWLRSTYVLGKQGLYALDAKLAEEYLSVCFRWQQ